MSEAEEITLAPPPGFATQHRHRGFTIALVGNPNSGKTSLFNLLTGLRAKTANFPGTTVERKVGRIHFPDHRQAVVVDLPGLYSLDMNSPDEKLASDALHGRLANHPAPNAALVVVDATNLERNLFLVSQVLELDLPVVVALNMMDMAERDGIHIDIAKLHAELGCPVLPIAARSGRGVEELKTELQRLVAASSPAPVQQHCKPNCGNCPGCPFEARYSWTEDISAKVMDPAHVPNNQRTDKLDEILTHPFWGIAAFITVMVGLFSLIFWAAQIPMELVDGIFANAQDWVRARVPEGDLQSLLANGVIGGIGGVLIFLPQICILFFALSLLDDTGYLARAAFVMDKIMRRFGLPGKAFVPLLSAHACAIPAIMSTRVIENPRDRLVTILIAPLMTCSARIPVYAMVTALVFPDQPLYAALTFIGAYATGIIAAMLTALLARRTLLPGGSNALVLELPPYRAPSLRTALLHTLDRAKLFVVQAGTIILAISLILWALSTYPKTDAPQTATDLLAKATALQATHGDTNEIATLTTEAAHLTSQHQLQHSIAGRLGQLIEPVIRPLGFDWQIGIGIITSFAAREVVVSSLSIIYGVGEEAADEDTTSLYDTLRRARRTDGTPVFTAATCASLLLFYILAAQCLATQAVVRRETGGWKWPLIQIAYMTTLAYLAALAAYQIVSRLA